MTSPNVGQLTVLAELFAEALEYCQPESVAIVGVAGGNGLDRIDTSVTRRIAGIDVNPAYLEAVRQRHGHLPGLEFCCVNLADQVVELTPTRLVHAACVLEHAGVGLCLDNSLALVTPGGAISIVLQLPSKTEQGVSPTPFESMRGLSPHFSMIEPAWLAETLAGRSFQLQHETRRELPAGKGFWMGIFRRS